MSKFSSGREARERRKRTENYGKGAELFLEDGKIIAIFG